MLGLIRNVVTIGSLGLASAVVYFDADKTPFSTTEVEAIEAQIDAAWAEIELVEAQKALREVQADVDAQRLVADKLVDDARASYPDLVSFIEARSDENVFAGRFAAHTIGVLLDPEPQGRLTLLLSRMNLLCGAPVVKACLFVENEYLCRLVRNF